MWENSAMRPLSRLVPVLAGVIVFAIPGLADEAKPAAGRYALAPAADGFVRLDTETGALSHCAEQDGVWRCEPLAEADDATRQELDALSNELSRLTAAVAAMGERVDALAARLDRGVAAAPTAGDEQRRTEAALGFAEKVMRRFFQMVREMKSADEANPI